MNIFLSTVILVIGFVLAAMVPAHAGTEKALKRDGWTTYETDVPFKELYPRLKEALKTSPLRQITTASASAGAKGVSPFPETVLWGFTTIFLPCVCLRQVWPPG